VCALSFSTLSWRLSPLNTSIASSSPASSPPGGLRRARFQNPARKRFPGVIVAGGRHYRRVDDDEAAARPSILGHKLVRRTMTDYSAHRRRQGDIARLKGEKETFEQSNAPMTRRENWPPELRQGLDRQMRELRTETRTRSKNSQNGKQAAKTIPHPHPTRAGVRGAPTIRPRLNGPSDSRRRQCRADVLREELQPGVERQCEPQHQAAGHLRLGFLQSRSRKTSSASCQAGTTISRNRRIAQSSVS